MKLKLVAAFSTLLVVAPALAQNAGRAARSQDRQVQANGAQARFAGNVAQEQKPAPNGARHPLPKSDIVTIPDDGFETFFVKFHDNVGARVLANGQVASTNAFDMTSVNAVINQSGLKFESLFEQSPQWLKQLEQRAFERSGRSQPDLAGMMQVTGSYNPRDVMKLADQLNKSDLVEFVQFIAPTENPSEGGAAGIPAACMGAQGSCFEAHPDMQPGCDNPVCCGIVCGFDDFCCAFEWDEFCAVSAVFNCDPDEADLPTPNFSAHQGYLSRLPYEDDEAAMDIFGLPADNLTPPFRGEGLNIENEFDDVGSLILGLVGVADLLLDEGIGDENMARGTSINVGVVEWGAYIDHEDMDINLEPGIDPDDLVLIPGISHPDHATACLGIIGANDDGIEGGDRFVNGDDLERGCIGVARDCQLWFFPRLTASKGDRFYSTIAAAQAEFQPGDILSYSLGPSGCGTLLGNGAWWTLANIGNDLGILSVIAAGNDCCDLDDQPPANEREDGETHVGTIVVGAGTPGRPFTRLPFSNFCIECEPDGGTNVHVQSWGVNTTSAGYGDGFAPGGNDARSYTFAFSGTSSAAPQMAGALACVQGIVKQFYGIPLGPEMLRGFITGIPQGEVAPVEGQLAGDIPPPLGMGPCGGDIAPLLPDPEPPNLIGVYPDLVEMANSIFSATLFDDSTLLVDYLLYRGDHIFGNVFSIKEAGDSAYLTIKSEYTTPDSGPHQTQFGIEPEFLGFGQSVDVGFYGEMGPTDTAFVTLSMEYAHNAPGPPIVIGELYNWLTGQWQTLEVVDTPGDDPLPGQLTPVDFGGGPSVLFVRQSDGAILGRIMLLTAGGDDPVTNPPYIALFDIIDLDGVDEIIVPKDP